MEKSSKDSHKHKLIEENLMSYSDSDKTILVIGGCGFLGSHVVEAFLNDGGFRVVAISRNPTKYLNAGTTYIACDATEHKEIAALIEKVKPSVIVHIITPGPFALPDAHLRDDAATKNLIELAQNSPSVKAFIYTGSVEGIANFSGARKEPLSESDAILYTNKTGPSAYARSKGSSDALVLHANGEDLLTAVLRFPLMYGPRDQGISPSQLKIANTFMTRIQLGDNKVVHDFIYIESAAWAHVLAAKVLLGPRKDSENRVDGEAFFITDGVPMKFWDFVRNLWAAAGDEKSKRVDNVIIIPWWVVLGLATIIEVLCNVVTFGRGTPAVTRLHFSFMRKGTWLSIEKARQRLGYSPLVRTEAGIKRTVAWFQLPAKGNTGKEG